MNGKRSGEALLRLQGVHKRAGNFRLHDISFEVTSGEYFVILGPTGAGKTLLLETIAGMYPVDSGEIWFDDTDITRLPPERRRFGFVYQDYALFPHLNVKENIAFGLKVNRTPAPAARQVIAEMADLLGISHLMERFPQTLSGGEQQRVALARALVMRPRVLLLDEPLAALDRQTKEVLRQELRRVHRVAGTLTIHVTHDFGEAFFLADRVGIMHNGRLVQTGTPREVFERPGSAMVARFVGAENVFTTEIICRDQKTFIPLGGTWLEVKTDLCGKVGISIRPEKILLSRTPQLGNNCVAVTVLSVHRRGLGLLVKLTVDAGGEKLSVLAAAKECAGLSLSEGSRIYCSIPMKDIHVFPCG